MIESLRRVHVLAAFRPYLRILQTFDKGNVRGQSTSLIKQSSRTFFVIVLSVAIPVVVFLGIWHMIENTLDINELVTSSALVLTYVQMFFIYVAIMVKNRLINKTLGDIQKTVDAR